VRVTGVEKDGVIRKEVDITDNVKWKSFDSNIAHVKNAVLYPKRLGKTRIECELKGFVDCSDISVEFQPKGKKVVYFQGVRRLQQIKFDSQDNLYLCNQSASVYRIAKAGGFEEVARIPLTETSASGIDCIAIDDSDNLYVNDMSQRICLRFPWTGHNYETPRPFATIVDGAKKSIAVDSRGHIFVAVMANKAGYIIHVYPDGEETVFSTRDTSIYLALDTEGNILTPSRDEQAIHVYNRDGELINVILHKVTDAESDILVDERDNIYLPFFHSGRLLKISQTESGTKADWIAEGFQAPGRIAMDSRSSIYISNFSGNSIDKIY
jgi:DNA-binding beta-propeller fold protein YncE